EQSRALEKHPYLLAQLLAFFITHRYHIHTIIAYFAGVWRIQPNQYFHEHGLAATTGTNNQVALTRLHGAADVLQYYFLTKTFPYMFYINHDGYVWLNIVYLPYLLNSSAGS